MAKPPVGIGNKYIEIIVDETGQTAIEAHGFNGVGCREATSQIEIGLGAVKNRKPKNAPPGKQGIKIG